MVSPSNHVVVPFDQQDNDHVFTNCHSFQIKVGRFTNHETKLVRISSYNIGISTHDLSTVGTFVDDLCMAKQVQLLVGYNPHHDKNAEITATLNALLKRHKTLQIRRLEKLHAKIVSIQQSDNKVHTWTGSLNLITPSLYDLMVKLDLTQSKTVCDYFDRLWNLGSVLFNR